MEAVLHGSFPQKEMLETHGIYGSWPRLCLLLLPGIYRLPL